MPMCNAKKYVSVQGTQSSEKSYSNLANANNKKLWIQFLKYFSKLNKSCQLISRRVAAVTTSNLPSKQTSVIAERYHKCVSGDELQAEHHHTLSPEYYFGTIYHHARIHFCIIRNYCLRIFVPARYKTS